MTEEERVQRRAAARRALLAAAGSAKGAVGEPGPEVPAAAAPRATRRAAARARVAGGVRIVVDHGLTRRSRRRDRCERLATFLRPKGGRSQGHSQGRQHCERPAHASPPSASRSPRAFQLVRVVLTLPRSVTSSFRHSARKTPERIPRRLRRRRPLPNAGVVPASVVHNALAIMSGCSSSEVQGTRERGKAGSEQTSRRRRISSPNVVPSLPGLSDASYSSRTPRFREASRTGLTTPRPPS
jgi:hypothetical protein